MTTIPADLTAILDHKLSEAVALTQEVILSVNQHGSDAADADAAHLLATAVANIENFLAIHLHNEE